MGIGRQFDVPVGSLHRQESEPFDEPDGEVRHDLPARFLRLSIVDVLLQRVHRRRHVAVAQHGRRVRHAFDPFQLLTDFVHRGRIELRRTVRLFLQHSSDTGRLARRLFTCS
jgi:hypothetical protein